MATRQVGIMSPLYDLVSTAILIPGDLLALPVNGKQSNLRRKDFAAPGLRRAFLNLPHN